MSCYQMFLLPTIFIIFSCGKSCHGLSGNSTNCTSTSYEVTRTLTETPTASTSVVVAVSHTTQAMHSFIRSLSSTRSEGDSSDVYSDLSTVHGRSLLHATARPKGYGIFTRNSQLSEIENKSIGIIFSLGLCSISVLLVVGCVFTGKKFRKRQSSSGTPPNPTTVGSNSDVTGPASLTAQSSAYDTHLPMSPGSLQALQDLSNFNFFPSSKGTNNSSNVLSVAQSLNVNPQGQHIKQGVSSESILPSRNSSSKWEDEDSGDDLLSDYNEQAIDTTQISSLCNSPCQYTVFSVVKKSREQQKQSEHISHDEQQKDQPLEETPLKEKPHPLKEETSQEEKPPRKRKEFSQEEINPQEESKKKTSQLKSRSASEAVSSDTPREKVSTSKKPKSADEVVAIGTHPRKETSGSRRESSAIGAGRVTTSKMKTSRSKSQAIIIEEIDQIDF